MAGRDIGAVVVEALMTIGAVTGQIAAGIIARSVRVLRHAPGAGVLRRGLSWRKRWADRALDTVGRLGKRVLATGCLLLVIVTGVLVVALRQINSALGQMRFPLELNGRQAVSAVDELRRSWSAYVTQIRPTRVIAEPTVLAERLFWLDLALRSSVTQRSSSAGW